MTARTYARLARVVGIDLRGLAALRVLLGVLLLVNLAGRLADFRAFYSADGLLNAEEAWGGRYLNPTLAGPSLFQPTAVLGDRAGAALLFAAGAAAGVMLVAGWRTFAGTLLGYLALLGLDGRNPHVLNAGDDLFRLLLFWSLFLPLGARWSLDATRSCRRRSNPYLSPGTFALLVQLALVYVVSAKFKSFESWVVEGSSIYYALHDEAYVTPVGHAVRGWLPLTWMTRATWWLELVGPLLLFSPVGTARLRYALAAAFIGLHLSVEAVMAVGLFSFVASAAWVVALPGSFWDRVESRLPRQAASRGPARPPAVGPGWLAAAFLLYVVAWNAWTLNMGASWFPKGARWVGEQLQIRQLWVMFAPTPATTSYWVEARATTAAGAEVLLSAAGRPVPRRPAFLSEGRSERWRKWDAFLINDEEPEALDRYAWFLLREARRSDPALVSVRLVLCSKETPPPGGGPRPTAETVLHFRGDPPPIQQRP